MRYTCNCAELYPGKFNCKTVKDRPVYFCKGSKYIQHLIMVHEIFPSKVRIGGVVYRLDMTKKRNLTGKKRMVEMLDLFDY